MRTGLIALAFLSRIAFADVAILNIDLRSLPAQAIVSSAAFNVSQSTDIQVHIGSAIFSPAPDGGCTGISLLETIPCPGNPFTSSATWTFCCLGPYYLANNSYFLGVSGPGFPFPGFLDSSAVIPIDPQAVHPGGTYQVSLLSGVAPGVFLCRTAGDFYCTEGSGGGSGIPPGGKVFEPTPFYSVDGTVTGTLDVQYSVGGVPYSADLPATTSFSYVTPEPESYGVLLFAGMVALIGLRAQRRHASRRVKEPNRL